MRKRGVVVTASTGGPHPRGDCGSPQGQRIGRRAGSPGAVHVDDRSESAENTAVACTLVQTAKLPGLNVEAYLNLTPERVAACEAPPGGRAALTPMADEEAQKGTAG